MKTAMVDRFDTAMAVFPYNGKPAKGVSIVWMTNISDTGDSLLQSQMQSLEICPTAPAHLREEQPGQAAVRHPVSGFVNRECPEYWVSGCHPVQWEVPADW